MPWPVRGLRAAAEVLKGWVGLLINLDNPSGHRLCAPAVGVCFVRWSCWPDLLVKSSSVSWGCRGGGGCRGTGAGAGRATRWQLQKDGRLQRLWRTERHGIHVSAETATNEHVNVQIEKIQTKQKNPFCSAALSWVCVHVTTFAWCPLLKDVTQPCVWSGLLPPMRIWLDGTEIVLFVLLILTTQLDFLKNTQGSCYLMSVTLTRNDG